MAPVSNSPLLVASVAIVIALVLIGLYGWSVWVTCKTPRYLALTRKNRVITLLSRLVMALIAIGAIEYVWLGVMN